MGLFGNAGELIESAVDDAGNALEDLADGDL